MLGERGGQDVGPFLPIHLTGNFSSTNLRTDVEERKAMIEGGVCTVTTDRLTNTC